ncbi:MAG: hypothetical protein NT075_13030 [Chloroflexi bacterium]|nr:hypothetical protein [Chloroflexota bacterium]
MKEYQEELKTIIKSARRELDEIEACEVKQQTQPLVGKCFKHQNAYAFSPADAHYWPLYLMISGGNRHLYGIRFEKDLCGRVAITPNCEMPSAWSDDYKQITRTEFITEWRKLLGTKRVENGDGSGTDSC